MISEFQFQINQQKYLRMGEEEERENKSKKTLELQKVGFMYQSFNFSMGQNIFKGGGKLLKNFKKEIRYNEEIINYQEQ